MTHHLAVVEVLVIHADQIDRCGGAQGVRDRGMLEVTDLS
jgi:death-on-curing protein